MDNRIPPHEYAAFELTGVVDQLVGHRFALGHDDMAVRILREEADRLSALIREIESHRKVAA